MEDVEKAGISYNVSRDRFETNQSYYRRQWFIASLKPKTEKEFKQYETYSRVFVNILLLKCRYDPKLEKKVMALADSVNNNKKKVKKSTIVRKAKAESKAKTGSKAKAEPEVVVV